MQDSIWISPFVIASEGAKDVQVHSTMAGSLPVNGARFKGKRIIYFVLSEI